MSPPRNDGGKKSEITFSLEEYAERLAAVRRGMQSAGVDTLLVHTFSNIFYLIGHQTTGLANYHCLVIPTAGQPFLVVRRLECLLAETTSWLDDFVVWDDHENPAVVTVRELQRRAMDRGVVGVDKGSISVSAQLVDQIVSGLRNATIKDAGGIVESLRRIKSPTEISYIKEAGRLTSLGILAGVEAVRPGTTENEVAAASVTAMYNGGSEFMSREPTVTSGPRSGIAHTSFKRRRIESGDAVLLEMSACYNRYSAPLMRVVSVGAPSAALKSYADVCVASLEAAIAAAKPGATAGDVEKAVADAYRAAGLSAGKRAGYSVGIGFPVSWMEADIIALKRDDPTVLEPGMVFHIVPAIREPRKFAVGCSETVLITPSGNEILTSADRKMFEV
jgi:Xaa-Pro dipeptidase